MPELSRGRLAMKYIFFEILPTFLLGVLIFIFIILMFQSFRLSEYIILHGASTLTILKLLFYLAISFVPVVLPMSLLFAVLLTYGRLSGDSEIVAMKSLGLNNYHIAIPALLLAVMTSILSAQTSFYLAPWGNRRMELIVHKLGQSKPEASIREGVFSEGFFDLVVYANRVDSDTGLLHKVFLYDERDKKSPLTIIAREGKMIKEKDAFGQKAFLRLIDGNIHRTSGNMYTKIDFQSYDINLFDPASFTSKSKTPLSYTLQELNTAIQDGQIDKKTRLQLSTEYHRRWAISMAAIVFAILGVGLGTSTNKRSSKSSGFVLCLTLVIGYWIVYAGFEGLGKSGQLPVWLAVWVTNILFTGGSLYTFKRMQS